MLVRVSDNVAQPADTRIEALLLAGFVCLTIALGLFPRSRVDWLLENVLALALVLTLLLVSVPLASIRREPAPLTPAVAL